MWASGRYKKMCETAEEVQRKRPTEWDYRDESFCNKGDWRDGPLKDLRMESFTDEYIWVPDKISLERVFFEYPRSPKGRKWNRKRFREWKKEKPGLVDNVRTAFHNDERSNAMTLIFVMQELAGTLKDWDFERDEWMDRTNPRT